MSRRLLLLGALAACPSREAFDREYAIGACERLARCEPGTLRTVYSGVEQCKQDWFALQEGVSACLTEHCTFDREAAATCLEGFGPGCVPPEEACGRVWVDCDRAAPACRGF